MEEKPFAVFAVAWPTDHLIAATTRPDGKIGLPGGKVEDGETPQKALLREAKEEGWILILASPVPCHKAIVEGKTVFWYDCIVSAIQNKEWKEKERGIFPLAIHPSKLTMDLGNEFIMANY